MDVRVFDCFVFFNELDLLEIRLRELNDVVDRFVLVEATRTFSGLPKPLHFQDNRDRYRPWLDKIIHVVVDDLPDSSDAWPREAFQRDCILRGLASAGTDDMVVISDVDEIPRAGDLRWATRLCADRRVVVFFEQRQFCYALDLVASGYTWWKGSRMVARRWLRSPQRLRSLHDRMMVRNGRPAWLGSLQRTAEIVGKLRAPLRTVMLRDAGWHFSYVGNVDAIRAKVAAFSHQELNRPELLSDDYIMGRVRDRRFFAHDSGVSLQRIAVDDSYPRCIRDHPTRYATMMAAGWSRDVERVP